MRIGICDDNTNDRQLMEDICLKVVENLSIDCEVVVFDEGMKLLGYENDLDVLILDIEMPEISGLEVKQRLRDLGKDCIIIFVTNHEELVFSAFGVNVHGFVRKQYLTMQLGNMLTSAIEILNMFVILEDNLDSREIKYMKSLRVYTELFLANGEKKVTRISIKKYEEILAKVGFVRIHKSYLVNLKWADKITEKEVFIGTEILPIATRLQKKVNLKFQEFCEKNARYC